MLKEPQPFPWFDESIIERTHDTIVASTPELRDHLKVFHDSFEVLHRCLRRHPYVGNTAALVVLRLIARVFNSAGACLKLGRAGYFQPAFAMVRDIVEIEFLADLFTRDNKYLSRWIQIDRKTRKKEFKPVIVRDTLDKLDGLTTRKREKAYSLLSIHASHVDLDGFQIISPGNMTQIGPFPSEANLAALFQELVKHMQWACIHLLKLLQPDDPEITAAVRILDRTLLEWRRKYSLIALNQP
ncbi:hypothetical protein OZ411_05380 [Bradyrhizobium sp. Arg237L]|uniref:hypothetical protein n=1 Tax=Bradyrhizobium sp. Arg237L TaxID=3003352 RepID=UPI00249EC793|nr:hypothetical protein [Bradyrhizobium sp. Arg237L]MDI4232247.1 hypothetical protein [Bradyrhizobium sp. Arg237L]